MKDKLLNYLNPIKGVSYKPSELRDSYEKDCFYLLRSNNIKNNNVNFDDIQIVKPGVVNNSQKLQPKDIVVCMSNGSKRLVGKNAQFKTKNNNYCVGAFCGGFRAKDFSKSDYLFQLFQSDEYQNYLDVTLAGSAINNLKSSDILKFEFYFPNPDYQQKIAKILNTIDAVIDKTEHAIAKYQAIKKGMMHDLFTRGIDIKTGQLRPSFKDAPELYKESALGMIPKDWELKSLSKLTNLITDGAHFSPIPQEDGLPIGNVKDMTAYGFNYGKCTLILKETFELLERQNCSPKKGDVLLSKDGTIGRVILFNDNRPIVLLSSIAIIRTNDLISGEYLSLVLQSFYFDKELFKLVSGSALKRITLKDIQKINIPYPTNEKEQSIIFSKLKSINDLIQKEQKILAKNQRIKKGLMQDLLTGKVEVKV